LLYLKKAIILKMAERKRQVCDNNCPYLYSSFRLTQRIQYACWLECSANLQSRFISIISSSDRGVALAILGSATTTAKHWAREMATLIRFRSRMNDKAREPYSP
jgi:hypothetical protein